MLEDDVDNKNRALNELKDDFKQVIDFKNQQERLIENQNEQIETKSREIEGLNEGSDERERELDRMRKAVDRLEDRRKHDAKTIYQLELKEKKKNSNINGLKSEMTSLYDQHHV